MPLAPLRISTQKRFVYVPNGNENLVGWKTAKHLPPQSIQQLISDIAHQKRWVSFALPTLRSLEARTTNSLHGPSDAAKSPLSGGRAQVAWKGLSGMDAARAALGHGWPVDAGPWNVTGAREPRRSRGRMQGQDFLLTFEGPAVRAFKKVRRPAGRNQANSNSARGIPSPLSHQTKHQKRKRPRLGVVFSIRWADGNGFFSRRLVSVGGPDRRPW